MAPTLRSPVTTALLLLLSASGTLQDGGSSRWTPYYGPYRSPHGRSLPQTSYGPPKPQYGAPEESSYTSHSGGSSASYGPPRPSTLTSSHSISGTFSRPTILHGSHSVSASYTSPNSVYESHSAGISHRPSHGNGHGQHGQYQTNQCATFIECSSDKACPSGQYCDESPHLPQCGKECLPDLPNTYPCERDYQCRSNYCDPNSHKCQLRPSPPDPCKGFMACSDDKECPADRFCGESPHLPACGHECLPDFPDTYYCERDYQCRSNYCDPETNKCRLRPSPPDPCKGFMSCHDDKECPADRYCGDSPHLPQCGHECLPDLPDTYDCQRDYQCRSDYCDPETYKCRLRPSPPDPCKGFMSCHDDTECPADRYCGDSPHLPQCGHECLPDLPDTYDCQRDYQCRSDYCDPETYKCRLRPSPPDPCKGFMACSNDKECPADRYCGASPNLPKCGHECLPDFPDTYDCDRDYQCRSNYCDPETYKCRLKPSPPDPCKGFMACSDDKQCPADRFCGESPHLPACGHECLPDLPNTYYCERDYQCRSNYCDPSYNVCKDRPSPPDPCAGFIPCKDDYACNVIQYCAPSPLRPHCGSECVPDLPNGAHCDRDYQCLSGFCHPDSYICKPQCYGVSTCYADKDCPASEHCSPSKTQPKCGKECQPDYPDMTYPCDRNEQCQSGYCDPNVGQCKTQSPCVDFVPCQGDFDCALEEHCGPSPTKPDCGNECIPDFPDMTPCTRHDQCLTDFCKPEVMQCKPRDTTPPEPCCLFGFTRLGDYCYELQLRNADYDGSRAYCQAQFSGDLSTVPSQEVNDLIVQLLDTANVTSAWVGISDRQTEGVFVDVTGAQQQFSQWGTGRPRNNGQRNCVEVAGDGYSETGDSFIPGEWNDLICEKQRSSVCRTGVLPICPKLRR